MSLIFLIIFSASDLRSFLRNSRLISKNNSRLLIYYPFSFGLSYFSRSDLLTSSSVDPLSLLPGKVSESDHLLFLDYTSIFAPSNILPYFLIPLLSLELLPFPYEQLLAYLSKYLVVHVPSFSPVFLLSNTAILPEGLLVEITVIPSEFINEI